MSGPAGRPSVYSDAVADRICTALGEGESLLEICRRADMPHRATVHRWLEEDREGFRDKYERARATQAHVRAEMAVEAATSAGDAGLGRLAYDALKWHAGKLLPKVYGDKVLNENQTLGKDGQPVDPTPLVVRFVNAKDGRPE